MKFDTNTMGFGLCVLGTLVLIVYILTGRGDPLQVLPMATAMILGGIGLIKSANNSEVITKDDLHKYGPIGEALDRGVFKSDAKEAAKDAEK